MQLPHQSPKMFLSSYLKSNIVFINLLLFWTHIQCYSVLWNFLCFVSIQNCKHYIQNVSVNTESLYLVFHGLLWTNDTSCTTSILKRNSPKQSTMLQWKHTWRELLKSKMGFTNFGWVALGCPSQQRPRWPCRQWEEEGVVCSSSL